MNNIRLCFSTLSAPSCLGTIGYMDNEHFTPSANCETTTPLSLVQLD